MKQCIGILVCFLCMVTHAAAAQVTCTGKVVDDQCNPITSANVTFYKVEIDSTLYEFKLNKEKELITKGDGTFSFHTEPIVPKNGMYQMAIILAQKQGHAFGWANWPLMENIDFTIRLSQTNVLTGIVVDESGGAVSGAEVRISTMTTQSPKGPRLYGLKPFDLLMVKTNEQGRFTFDNIPGDALVDFQISSLGQATISTFSPTGIRGVTMQFSPGQPDIKLTLPVESKINGVVVEKGTGKTVSGVRLLLQEGQDKPLYGRDPIISRQDGTFSIEALTTSEHILNVVSPKQACADRLAEPVKVQTEPGKNQCAYE